MCQGSSGFGLPTKDVTPRHESTWRAASRTHSTLASRKTASRLSVHSAGAHSAVYLQFERSGPPLLPLLVMQRKGCSRTCTVNPRETVSNRCESNCLTVILAGWRMRPSCSEIIHQSSRWRGMIKDVVTNQPHLRRQLLPIIPGSHLQRQMFGPDQMAAE